MKTNTKTNTIETRKTNEDNMQHILATQFSKNLEFLKHYDPALAHNIATTQTQHYSLGLDQNEEFNIWVSTKWLYDSSPLDYARLQVKKAIHHPEVLQLQQNSRDSSQNHSQNQDKKEYRFLQQYFLEQIRLVQSSSCTVQPQVRYTPTLVFFGNGLGIHLKDTLEAIDSDQVFIFEPEIEFFIFSLFITDYTTLLKTQNITFIIGQSEDSLFHAVQQSMQPLLFYKATQIQVIRHYGGKKTTDAYNTFSQKYGLLFDNMGFMEDECVGVSQFLLQLEKPIQFLKNNTPLKNNAHLNQITIPAVIVGSGPSIDHDIDQLKRIRNKVIIFSCSSSIGILHHHQITPDFHVECERLHYMHTYLTKLNDPAYLKKVHLLSLNPCDPKIASHFQSHTLALKYSDMGTHLWQALTQKHSQTQELYTALQFCGPTSGNCALAFAAHCNFHTIIALGLDFGQRSHTKHHSQFTRYYTMQWRALNTISIEHEVPGNFGGTVGSTLLLDKGRQSAQLLAQASHCRFINCSDGALIQGMISQRLTQCVDQILELSQCNHDHKIAIVHDFLHTKRFHMSHHQQLSYKHHFETQWIHILNTSINFISHITIQKTPQSIQDWHRLFDTMSQAITHFYAQNKLSAQLILGNIVGLQTATATVLFQNKHNIDFMTISETLTTLWNNALNAITQRCFHTHGQRQEQLETSITQVIQNLGT